MEAVRKKDFSKLEAMFISDEDARFLKKQKRVALRNCGVVDPTSIDDLHQPCPVTRPWTKP